MSIRRFFKDWFRTTAREEKIKTALSLAFSIVAAVVLWSLVLSNENPNRNKTVYEVPTSFEGEAELLAKGLCIRGDRQELLDRVSVSVKTRVKNYTSVSVNTVSATVNLKNISEAKEYELPVQAIIANNLGTVSSVSPETVTVQIDTLVTKTVPVQTRYEGTVQEGYWADMANSSATIAVDIQGAKTDVMQIKRAECVVDLTGADSSIYGLYDIVLYDGEGNVLPNDIVIGMIPTSTVRVPVYATRTISVDAFGSLVGMDSLPAYHSLDAENVTVTPATVRVVGDKTVLDQIDSLMLEPISISGQTGTAIYSGELVLPEGVRVIDSSLDVSVSVNVREEMVNVIFEKVRLEITDIADGLAVGAMTPEYIDVSVTGGAGIVSVLNRGDIILKLSAKDYEAGTFTVDLGQISLVIRDDATTQLMQAVLLTDGQELKNVSVTLEKAAA